MYNMGYEHHEQPPFHFFPAKGKASQAPSQVRQPNQLSPGGDPPRY